MEIDLFRVIRRCEVARDLNCYVLVARGWVHFPGKGSGSVDDRAQEAQHFDKQSHRILDQIILV